MDERSLQDAQEYVSEHIELMVNFKKVNKLKSYSTHYVYFIFSSKVQDKDAKYIRKLSENKTFAKANFIPVVIDLESEVILMNHFGGIPGKKQLENCFLSCPFPLKMDQ